MSVYRLAQDWGYTNYINCIYNRSGTPIAALSGINRNIMTDLGWTCLTSCSLPLACVKAVLLPRGMGEAPRWISEIVR